MGYKDDRILEFLPWAQRFARSCANRLPQHLDRDDLQSAGVLGYLKAAGRYHSAKGASFRGYCAVRIRGAVLDELRRWDWAPRSVHKNKKRINQVVAGLANELEREPTRQELAQAMGLDLAELDTLQSQAATRQVVSFDETGDNGHGEEMLGLSDRVADLNAKGPDLVLRNKEDREAMLACIGALTKSQATVIVLHYLKELPLRDVAEHLRVTPSRVSQIHHQALGRLRQSWERSQKN